MLKSVTYVTSAEHFKFSFSVKFAIQSSENSAKFVRLLLKKKKSLNSSIVHLKIDCEIHKLVTGKNHEIPQLIEEKYIEFFRQLWERKCEIC